jgi:hypothetical protein
MNVAKNENVTAGYRALVGRIRGFGMPVGFLLEVGKQVEVFWHEGMEETEVEEVTNWITPRKGLGRANRPAGPPELWVTLHFGDMASPYLHDAAKIDPFQQAQESSAIGQIFHESTHAYFDLKRNDPQVGEIIQKGVAYYKDAPMQDGSTAAHPDRVFTEAAASYVGDRAGAWWDAFESLSTAFLAVARDRWTSFVAFQNRNYTAETRNRQFGYEERVLSGGKIFTTRPISDELREFCNHQLLEDKMPDEFDRVPGFQQLLRSMTAGDFTNWVPR